MIDYAMLHRLMTLCKMDTTGIDPKMMTLARVIFSAGMQEERASCLDICAQHASCEGIAQKIYDKILARG